MKLKNIGISGKLLAVLTDYLTNRVSIVSCLGVHSEPFFPTSGVPQGSNLGPLLFNIFLNDIVCDLKCGISVYADDAKLCHIIEKESEMVMLQNDVNKFNDWCIANKLDLNAKKCKKITFTRKLSPIITNYYIGGVLLENIIECKDLGVTFDSKLTFVNHIESIVNSCKKTLAFVLRVSKLFQNVKVIRTLYCSLVWSRFDYASLIWSPNYQCHINSIESIHRKFLKFMAWKESGIYPEQGAVLYELCNDFYVLSLAERRNLTAIIFLVKVMRGNVDCPGFLEQLPFRVPVGWSRCQVPFYLPFANSMILINSPLYRACNLVNKLLTFAGGTLTFSHRL